MTYLPFLALSLIRSTIILGSPMVHPYFQEHQDDASWLMLLLHVL